MSFPELAHPERVETPVLTVAGEQAATRPLSEAIHGRLATTKRLVAAPDAGRVDLYHRTDLTLFDEIGSFLTRLLRQ